MKITFIGTGYVGLVSGVMMAHVGHDITCLDVDQNKIDTLLKNKSPIYEPKLEEYIIKYSNKGNLKFVCGYNEAISESEAIFITVGTPPKDNGEADLSIVYASIEQVLKYVSKDCVFVLKSTVPPGTCAKVQQYIYEQGAKNQVVSNPEFLREGSAVNDFINPDRVIIGSESDIGFKSMQTAYAPFKERNIEILETNLATAEIIKYASNSFLATKIAFINEMADICESVGGDVETLANGMGMDKRIGRAFLNAGPGYGGSCFPKDVMALAKLSKNINSESLITNSVMEANDLRFSKMTQKIIDACGGDVQNKKIAILGITYKAGTDDLRCSPAIPIIKSLQDKGAKITAFDPKGSVNAEKYFDQLDCAESILDAATDADAAVIITEWPEFKNMDLVELKQAMITNILIDLRNLFDPIQMQKLGFAYHSIGRKSV